MRRHFNPGKLFYFLMAGLLLPRIVYAQTLTVGTVGRSPTEQIQRILPVTNYLAAQLKTHGFNKAEIVFANSPREMVQRLVHGEVDLYFDNALFAAAVGELSGSKLLLRRKASN
jgi:ABC-type phosphate/phosphonate transport system substrate-binding protein